mmetsp:Transcript_129774/g.361563  ORF Transcript_129774/g.361563 Transcript_129774/m.361563 type:complete len:243 (+) Transcript_129774:925-1653(+)
MPPAVSLLLLDLPSLCPDDLDLLVQLPLQLCMQTEALFEGRVLGAAHLEHELLPQLREEPSEVLSAGRCGPQRWAISFGAAGAARSGDGAPLQDGTGAPAPTRAARWARCVLGRADAVLRHLRRRASGLHVNLGHECSLWQLRRRARPEAHQQTPEHARGLRARCKAILQDTHSLACMPQLLLHGRTGLVDACVCSALAAGRQEFVELTRLIWVNLAEHAHALHTEVVEFISLRTLHWAKQI